MQKVKLIALLGIAISFAGVIGWNFSKERQLFESSISKDRRLEVVARKKLLATGYFLDLRYFYKSDCVMSVNLGVYDSIDDFDLKAIRATQDGFALSNKNYYKIDIGYSVNQ